MRTLNGFGSVVGFSCLALLACGEGVPESNVTGGAASSTGASASSGGSNSSAGTLSLGGQINAGGASSSGGENSGATGGIEQCAAANAAAELAPVYLAFLLDESGSMGDGVNGKRAQKWDPVTSALKSFFADPASTGITASLTVFPLNQNLTMGAADSKKPASCKAADYEKPVVVPTALPDDKTFAPEIAKLDPPNEYGTPTLPALSGTISYAESLIKADASRKVAIVMVTDGEPYGCNGNTVDATAMAAAQVAKTIPTYVIGVGKELASLNQIATSGGTEKAFIVALDNADQTRKDLLAAINLIRGKSISCDLPIPAPPAGKKLDPDKVDVQFSGSAATSTLKYGLACTGDVAWHYDDASKPTMIQLCDSACSTVKSDPKGKLDVVFGCIDRVVVQ